MLCPNHPHFWSALWLFCSVFMVEQDTLYTLGVKNYLDHCLLFVDSYHYHRYIWPPIVTVPDLRWHWGRSLQLGPEDDHSSAPEPGNLADRDSRLSIVMFWLCSSPWYPLPPSSQDTELHTSLWFTQCNQSSSCHISSNMWKLQNLGLINRF